MKIVAIGGGNNSDIKKNGMTQIYEHEAIDKEIIRLSEKNKPNVLFISHASDYEFETASYNKIVRTFNKMYSCPTKLLSLDMLDDFKLMSDLINWSDIIYVGGGNTKKMIELWEKYNVHELLKSALLNEKVLCGISAGANCWFNSSCSDYLQMELNDPNAPFTSVNGLNFVNILLNPHANCHDRLEGVRNILKNKNISALHLSNNMAIEIVDNYYKLIRGISCENEEIFAKLSYYDNGEYYIRYLQDEGMVRQLTHH